MDKAFLLPEKAIVPLIQEIAEEEKLKFKNLHEGTIIQLENKEGIRKFIVGHRFELNSTAASDLCDDKVATSIILSEANIPHIDHKMFLNPARESYAEQDQSTWEKILEFGEQNNFDLICKPISGSLSQNVIRTRNKRELQAAVHKIWGSKADIWFFSFRDELCLSKFYDYHYEHRLVMLKGQCELIYSKVPPQLMGDGTSSIKDLFCKFLMSINENARKNFLKNMNSGDFLSDKILEKNKKITLGWLVSGHYGGNVDTHIKNEPKKRFIIDMAAKAVKALNLTFGSVDIIENNDTGDIRIIEVNAGVKLDKYFKEIPNGRQEVKEIYRKAVLAMFSTSPSS